MGLFSRNKPEPEKPVVKPSLSPNESRRISLSEFVGESFGTSNLDEVLQLFAPRHEATLEEIQQNQKQIIMNQQRILDELTRLRHYKSCPDWATSMFT